MWCDLSVYVKAVPHLAVHLVCVCVCLSALYVCVFRLWRCVCVVSVYVIPCVCVEGHVCVYCQAVEELLDATSGVDLSVCNQCFKAHAHVCVCVCLCLSSSGCGGSTGCHQWCGPRPAAALQGVPPAGTQGPAGRPRIWTTVVQQADHQVRTHTHTRAS